MNGQIVKVLKADYVTHDVKRFVVEKPPGFNFLPGQATEISINQPEWQDKLRPFTFTCANTVNYLEFMIKIYRDHQGVTSKLGGVNAGAELIIHDVFGAIHYQGPGVFIAAGAGITPFISILRTLHLTQQLDGNRLIYSNKTSEDVIINEELEGLLQDDFVKVFTRENIVGFYGKRIDRNFLISTIRDFSQHFYVCGPDDFVVDINKQLLELGASPNTLVFEQ